MKSSNNSSLNASTDSVNRSTNTNGCYEINPLQPKRYYAEVTIDMIDDFMNPFTALKDPSRIAANKMQLVPPPSTNGLGLRDEQGETDDLKAPAFFCNRNNKDNREYAKQARRQFEKELIDSAAMESNAYESHIDDRSIVGSAMSQIESVTTLNVSTTQRIRTMNEAQLLAKIGYNDNDDESIDLNNNLEKQLQMTRELKDVSLEERRKQFINETSKDYMQRKQQPNLPITIKRTKIIDFVDVYQFGIIRGGTGCGKTTQVPQYILDDHMEKKKYCKIIVTQPRRIAAISIAKRVCSERGWTLGETCGYQIGLERKCDFEKTLITYVTTGVLLQKLIGPQAEENFETYTHIILDEVHERDLDTDFVLLVIKLKSFRNLKAKIILMSATINCDLFCKYFATEKFNIVKEGKRIKERVPILDVENNVFDVQEFYWDDLVANNSFLYNSISTNFQKKMIKMNRMHQRYSDRSFYQRNYRSKNNQEIFSSFNQYHQHIKTLGFNADEPEMNEDTMNMCISLLNYFDEEDHKMVSKLDENDQLNATLSSFNSNDQVPLKNNRLIDNLPEYRGSVLIFVPGMHDIQTLNDLITKEFPAEYKIDVIPLHSEIPLLQQQRVFLKPQACHRKVIISTSIAESSITVSDIKYVIDFCLTKELYSDPQTNYTHLRQEWASRSSLNQRRGRAGRVSDGICYRLITRDLYRNYLEDDKLAAMQREPLSRTLLNVKRLNLVGEPKKILSLAIEPPKLIDIERTILLLKEVGALTLSKKQDDGTIDCDPSDGDLTYAGKIMANLPIDVRLSKLILLGHVFGKLKEAIIIAAGLSTKTIFTNLYKSYMESYKSKWLWAAGWMCDCLAILNAVKTYEMNTHEKNLLNSHKEKIQWCKNNNIEFDRLREVLKLIEELDDRLNNLQIKSSTFLNPNRRSRPFNSNGNKLDVKKEYDLEDEEQYVKHNLIIKMMIAGAFYPNYLNSVSLDLDEAYRQIGYHDLKNTVQVRNIPNNEGLVYREKLCDIFRPFTNAILIHFENTRAYIEFKDEHDEVKSNINFSVYLAVEMRLLRLPLKLKRLAPQIAQERLRRLQSNNENHECDIALLNESGVVKFSIGSLTSLNRTMSQSLSKSQLNDSLCDSLNHTLVEENEEIAADSDSDSIEFFQGKDISTFNAFDKKEYLSCATLMSTALKKAESNRNLETSSRLSQSKTNLSQSKNSFHGSVSSISGNRRERNQLSSNRYTPSADHACSIVDYLRNPKFLLPEEVDNDQKIKISVTEIIECGHFWAQIYDEPHRATMNTIQDILNKSRKLSSQPNLASSMSSLSMTSMNHYQFKLLNPINIVLNALCVAPFSEDNQFYRAQIININKLEHKATVLFIDFGNREKKHFDQLFEMSIDLYEYPFQAIECKLANIKMSVLKNPNSVWTPGANDFFRNKVKKRADKNGSLKIKILDLVDTVAMVQMENILMNKDIGEEIVEAGYAELIEPKKNHLYKTSSIAGSERVVFVPTRQSDYTSKRPCIAGGAMHSQELGQFNVRSKLFSSRYGLNDTDNYDDYDHDDSLSFSEQYYNGIFHEDEASYEGEIDLNGPYSPLEIAYHPLVNIGRTKKTRVQRGSVNHVTLEDDPENKSSRLMITNEIVLDAYGSTMTLRNTTVMPKLPGLTEICCLLYSPIIEFRLDEKKTRLTGILCGLGANKSENASIYADNDIEIPFNVYIDTHDIKMINQVRLAINNIIGNESLAKEWTNDDTKLKAMQLKACTKLLEVIERSRKPIEPHFAKRPYRWNQLDSKDFKEWTYNENKTLSEGNTFNEYYCYHHIINLKDS